MRDGFFKLKMFYKLLRKSQTFRNELYLVHIQIENPLCSRNKFNIKVTIAQNNMLYTSVF